MMLWQRWRAVRGSMMPLLLLGTTHTTSALGRTTTSATAFLETTAVSSRSSRTTIRPPTTRCFWLGAAATAGGDAAEFFSTSSTTSNKQEETAAPSQKRVPIVLLSGFLGTGKTSTLQHLLENKEQLKIGVIVNDLASVNIDRKLLVASWLDPPPKAADDDNLVLELQNGCACCALSDELAFSIEKLLANRALDAVVVELSGVADPAAVRYNLSEQPPPTPDGGTVETPRIVTLIDAASFGTDYLTWDTARDRENWVPSALPMMENGDDSNPDSHRKVSELLVEQCEAADLILVNKVDLLREQHTTMRIRCGSPRGSRGRSTPRPKWWRRNLDAWRPAWCWDCHRSMWVVVVEVSHSTVQSNKDDDDDATATSTTTCTDPDCTDASHAHSHSHNDHDTSCSDPDCTDESHSHSSHDHHHRSGAAKTSTDDLGIQNFVYKATRPFHVARLMKVLNQWPVPIKDTLDMGVLQDATAAVSDADATSPFVGVLRSKGFCWFAPQKWTAGSSGQDAWRHDTAMFWSHAGRHFGISATGKWWGAMPDRKMKQYFVGNMAEYERIVREDFQTDEFQDRRQEIVFIGTQIDKDLISATLDSCLYTDREMDEYRQKLRNYMDTLFTSPPVGSAGQVGGLFDVGTLDHTDLR